MKKSPERMCIGCGQMKQKLDLIRVVKNKENDINVDPVGKMPGRGAYLCKDILCFEKAKKARRLERSFRGAISQDVYDKLREQIASAGHDSSKL